MTNAHFAAGGGLALRATYEKRCNHLSLKP